MAAILPHLAQPGETTKLEKEYWRCSSSGLEGPSVLCPTPQQVVDQSHANLLTIAWTRKVILEQLAGAIITPKYDGDDVILAIDKSPAGPLWNPLAERGKTSLLTWTSKMGAPSFSMAAGSTFIGGSCPAAAAGQSVVPNKEREKVAETLVDVLGIKEVQLANAICQYCYAMGGRYPAASAQFDGLVRYAWAKHAIEVDYKGKRVSPGSENCLFVGVMIEAIENAEFYIEGKYVKEKKTGRLREDIAPEPPQWRAQRFFRLHDSGDMFAPSYLKAWKNIANHFREKDRIVFWAPSRIWALGPTWLNHVRNINGEPKEAQNNLVIRPSGYHVDQHGVDCLTEEDGWAACTVVYRHEKAKEAQHRTFDWDCKAYSVEGGPNCRRAENPDGITGCRTCWMRPDLRVNYTLH